MTWCETLIFPNFSEILFPWLWRLGNFEQLISKKTGFQMYIMNTLGFRDVYAWYRPTPKNNIEMQDTQKLFLKYPIYFLSIVAWLTNVIKNVGFDSSLSNQRVSYHVLLDTKHSRNLFVVAFWGVNSGHIGFSVVANIVLYILR